MKRAKINLYVWEDSKGYEGYALVKTYEQTAAELNRYLEGLESYLTNVDGNKHYFEKRNREGKIEEKWYVEVIV